jgi:predicted nucleic acid-binding protein
MRILLDTGILLRVLNRGDPFHTTIRSAVRVLKMRGDQAVTTLQDISEFWNVCTRPVSARGGLGLTIEQTERRLSILERGVQVLPEPASLYERWRELVVLHRVLGVNVHDAKLVAAMTLYGISHILTLNAADFGRYSVISAMTPQSAVIP